MSERRERRRGGQVLTFIVVVVVMYTSVFRGQDPMRERERARITRFQEFFFFDFFLSRALSTPPP